MTPPSIRPAGEADLAAVRELGQRSWRDAYAGHLPPDEIERGLAEWWSDQALLRELRHGQMLVVELDRLVAVASGERHDSSTWTLWKLYVAPEHRSRGIGALLLHAYIARLPRDINCIVLEHYAFNDRAARFYEREGFVVEGTSRGQLPETQIVWRRRCRQKRIRSTAA